MFGLHRRLRCRGAAAPTDAAVPALGPGQATGRRRSRVAVLEDLLGPQGLLAGGECGDFRRRRQGDAVEDRAAADRPPR